MRDAADERALEEIRLQPQVRVGKRGRGIDPLEGRRGLRQDRLDAVVQLSGFAWRLVPEVDREHPMVGGAGRDRLERPHIVKIGIDQETRIGVAFDDHLRRLCGEPRRDGGIVDRNLGRLLLRLDQERLAAEMARQIVLHRRDEIGVRRA